MDPLDTFGPDLEHAKSGPDPVTFGKKRRRPWVPIRSLAPRHRNRIASHLLALDARDRYLRFGHATTDEEIQRYAEHLDFSRDELFGIFNRRLELIAIAHLAYSPHATTASQTMAEFGVSVRDQARGRGYGARLFRLAVVHARNRGCDRLLIHALSENTAMLRIAVAAGASVERSGPEADAWLKLPTQDAASRMDELLQAQAAEWNYRLKRHVHRFKKWVRDKKYVHTHKSSSHSG